MTIQEARRVLKILGAETSMAGAVDEATQLQFAFPDLQWGVQELSGSAIVTVRKPRDKRPNRQIEIAHYEAPRAAIE